MKTIRELLGPLSQDQTGEQLAAHSYGGLTKAQIDALAKKDIQTYTGKVRDVVRVGDELLQAVVHAVRRELRPEDTLARTGGDEFAVLLPRADRQAARRVQERLTRVVDELRVPVEGGGIAQAGVSVGLAMHGDLPNPTIESWLDAADAAMYLRKRTTYAQRSIAS